MNLFLKIGAIVVVVITGLRLATVRRAAPDRVVTFSIYEHPEDEDKGDLVFAVRLALTAAESVGRDVGWKVTEVRVSRPSEEGEPDTVWIDSKPVFETQDGLWWIRHDNPKASALSDFVEPPRLSGVALSGSRERADMNYELEGRPYVAPREGPAFETTSALSYVFMMDGAIDPDAEGDDEPVGVDPDISDPPLGGPTRVGQR